jgi:hypothetical protein
MGSNWMVVPNVSSSLTLHPYVVALCVVLVYNLSTMSAIFWLIHAGVLLMLPAFILPLGLMACLMVS